MIRTSYFKYFHPKEALITSGGVLNRAILNITRNKRNIDVGSNNSMDHSNLSFVYPFGSTLNVVSPAVAVLSSGTLTLPVNRPVAAFYESGSTIRGGKIVVLASAHLLHDNYIEKEDNSLIKDLMFDYINNQLELNPIDAKDPEISDYIPVPDLEHLTEQPFSCLHEGDPLPTDFTKLFSRNMYSFDNQTLALVHEAYTEMQMEPEPLRLIKPQFETPLPALTPATFPPNFMLPPKPKLQLFDLDDAFSSASIRLMQIANKCSDEDLEYFIKESGTVLGVENCATLSAKSILHFIFGKLVEYKKVNTDELLEAKLDDEQSSRS